MTLSWFLELVVGFLKEPWGAPTTPLLLPQILALTRTGTPGDRVGVGTGSKSRGAPRAQKLGEGGSSRCH